MRFIRTELSPANKKQYLMAMGLKDIELLYETALLAHKYMPNTKELKDSKRRLSKISRAFGLAIEEAKQDGDDGERVAVADRQAYKDRLTANPMLDITRMEVIDHRQCASCNGRGVVLAEDYGQKPRICLNCNGRGSGGRNVVFWDSNVEVKSSIQDEGRTLKLFVDDRKPLQAEEKPITKKMIDDNVIDFKLLHKRMLEIHNELFKDKKGDN